LQLTGTETAGSLSVAVSLKAAEMLPGVLKNILGGTARPAPQDHGKASYCRLLDRPDGIIDWKMSAARIEAMVRAYDPWPLCRSVHNGRELYVLKAAVYRGGARNEEKAGMVLGVDKQCGILVQTGEGILAVTHLQYQAKKALFWVDFLNGARDFSGSHLG
jgi:methionyl-tRNA formyltransferase